jgi:hypothetical protein
MTLGHCSARFRRWKRTPPRSPAPSEVIVPFPNLGDQSRMSRQHLESVEIFRAKSRWKGGRVGTHSSQMMSDREVEFRRAYEIWERSVMKDDCIWRFSRNNQSGSNESDLTRERKRW